MEKYILGFALLAGGTFSFMGGMKGWPWFMEHRKVRFMAKMFGITGARIFYAILGLLMCLVGLAFLIFGVPDGGML